MTRLYSEGFEMQDLVGLTYYDCAINASVKRSGAASLLINDAAGYLSYSIADLDEFYIRAGLYITGNNDNRMWSIVWKNGSTILGSVSMYITGSSVVQAAVGGTIYGGTGAGTGTIDFNEAQWYSIEVHVLIDDAAGALDVKVEGVDEITYAGDTKPGADTVADTIVFYNLSYGGTGKTTNVYIDDIGINDTAGGVDDTWLGDGKIIVIKPNGDTATLELTPSAAVDHYTLVDDIPADSDTTYVEGSVDDEEDIYDLQACGLTDVIITRIWTEARARDTAASGKSVALITLASGGAEVSGGDVALTSTYNTKVLGAEELVNPVDAAAWEVADIDALQGGPRTRP